MKRIFIAVAILFATACSPEHSTKEVPAEVLGEWTTKSEEYAGRAFRITPTSLTIIIDRNTEFVHEIEAIEVRDRHGRPFITLHHRNRDGLMDTFRIEYTEYPSTFIRLENVEHVYWTQDEAST